MSVVKLSRRDFLRLGGGAAAGLALGVRLPPAARASESAARVALAPSAFLSIDPSGAVTVWVAKSEMGQGVRTSLPMIVAEELEAEWEKVRIEPAVADPKYGRMGTGGSTSVRTGYIPLRKVGAAAREMLVAAAAARFGVEPSECRAERGTVAHPPSGRRLGYGELVAEAAKLPVPAEPRLKDPKDFRILGRPAARLDTPDKVAGRAVFGLDVRVTGMLFAVVARAPVWGARVTGFDAAATRGVSGVRDVVQVPTGVAVLADSTWAALRGREALKVAWDAGPHASLDDAAIRRLLAEKSRKADGVARKEGEGEKGLSASRRLRATYEVPLLAHATMEPMNCTASVRAGEAEIWAPTQSPQWAQEEVARAVGVAPERVRVHTTLLGGGFGRRAMPDFAVEAAQVSQKAGRPVQVLWTREDDMRHDHYRPPSLHLLRAGLDAEGRLVAWTHRVVAPSILRQVFGEARRPGTDRPDVVEGAWDLPYAVPSIEVDYAIPELPVPLGWWRSVYSSQTAFANECFLDEVARVARKDPFALRRQLLSGAPRLRGALELAAEKAGWGGRLPRGRGRGIACHASFGSFVAQVAEVSVADGEVRVRRVVAAVDCGRTVNPDTIEAQIEGAVVYGLSAALRGAIRVERGMAKEGNFDDYEPLRLREMPAVEVHVVPSEADPGGIGEPGVPPAAPALANAIFAASGRRVRRLPVGKLA